jgi:hypothetical protein
MADQEERRRVVRTFASEFHDVLVSPLPASAAGAVGVIEYRKWAERRQKEGLPLSPGDVHFVRGSPSPARTTEPIPPPSPLQPPTPALNGARETRRAPPRGFSEAQPP